MNERGSSIEFVIGTDINLMSTAITNAFTELKTKGNTVRVISIETGITREGGVSFNTTASNYCAIFYSTQRQVPHEITNYNTNQ